VIIAPKPALSSNGGIPSGLYLIYVLFEGYLIRAGGAGHEPEAVVEKLWGGRGLRGSLWPICGRVRAKMPLECQLERVIKRSIWKKSIFVLCKQHAHREKDAHLSISRGKPRRLSSF